jgi:hypothetical protein
LADNAGHSPAKRRTPLVWYQGNFPSSDGITSSAYEKDPCIGVLRENGFLFLPVYVHEENNPGLSRNLRRDFNQRSESRRGDLNPRPADYESAAIPLSHGGAIPHNISICANKICGWTVTSTR